MIGVVSNEGILRSAPFVRQDDIRLEINKDFDKLKNFLALGLSVEPILADSLWEDVKRFYFAGIDDLDEPDSIEPILADSLWEDVKRFYFAGIDDLDEPDSITGLTD
ncbi:hypothetical protein QE152_g41372, partial [Popillia japonica]